MVVRIDVRYLKLLFSPSPQKWQRFCIRVGTRKWVAFGATSCGAVERGTQQYAVLPTSQERDSGFAWWRDGYNILKSPRLSVLILNTHRNPISEKNIPKRNFVRFHFFCCSWNISWHSRGMYPLRSPLCFEFFRRTEAFLWRMLLVCPSIDLTGSYRNSKLLLGWFCSL